MKLHRLRLENFRQFRDEQEIQFATGKEDNVTLIWGANGSGKTTLLNAFTWVLYGTFTKDFEQPELLYNLDAWSEIPAGGSIRVSVELEFENGGQIFTARRESSFVKAPDETARCDTDANVTLEFIDASGRSERSGNPGDHIRQILPERLHSFFFFNGERIEHLVQASAYEEIEDAIKTILGLKVVERAISHLPKTAKTFEDILRTYGTDEQRELTTQLEDLDEQSRGADALLEESRKSANLWQDELDAIDQKLRGSEQAREHQRRRDELTDEEHRLDDEIRELGERIDRLIRERGFLAPGLSLFRKTREQFVDKRERKELPAPVKRDFIEDLLADRRCICGASLDDGTPGHEHISQWRERAGLVEVEQRWNELFSNADSYAKMRDEMSAELENHLADRARCIARRQHVREQLSEVSTELRDQTQDDIGALESARELAKRNREEELRKQGRIEQERERFAADKSALESKLTRAASGEAKAELARRRLSATREALNTLEKIFEIRTEQTRSDLDVEIKRIYGSISYKPYVPEVSNSFQLDLLQRESKEPVAKSTGENQILSLSFVGALASIARARYEETAAGSGGVRGGIYPIVMDAAFGSLDLSYRREVSLGLPTLAEQVVVIVSKSGGEGAVEHLENRVGKSYVIRYETPKSESTAETIILDDQEYPYIEPSGDGSEYAEMIEVR